MTTFIPRPDALGARAIDPLTQTIARLANELFSETRRGALIPGSNPVLTPPTSDSGLGGAYPAQTNAIAPPVHPVAPQGAGPSRSDQADTYPFGEPHPESSLTPGNNRGPLSSWRTSEPSPDRQLPARPDHELYFLRGESAPVRPAAGEQATPGSPAATWFDVERVRADFPALHQSVNGHPLVWLDNAATTHKPQAVLDATSRFFSRDNSNIHRAAHTLAARATEVYEAGREKVRQFLGAQDAREIVFVRGTTEAINLVAQTFGRKFIGSGDEIVLTTMEHHANIVPWQLLAEQTGAVLRVAPINDRGELILEQLASLLGAKTKLVSVTHVANALGTINPVQQIIGLAHGYGVPVLVDGAQSAPHLPVNVQALDADFFVFSGHKVFGPTGIGALYGKAKWLEQLPPYQGGGNMIRDVTFAKTSYQEPPQRFEAGTQNIAGVAGLSAAIDYLHGLGLPAIAAYEHDLLVYATRVLSDISRLRLIGTAAEKASVLSFVIDGQFPEDIARHLDRNGIAVRAGHHCAQPALRRFGLESTVRPSLAFYNTREEIDALAQALHTLPRK